MFASQCRAGLTRVGNRVNVMFSHARLLHLRHFMRGRARSWTSHIVASASIRPCMSYCMDSTLKTLSDRITIKSCRVHVSPLHVTFQHSSMAFMSRQGRHYSKTWMCDHAVENCWRSALKANVGGCKACMSDLCHVCSLLLFASRFRSPLHDLRVAETSAHAMWMYGISPTCAPHRTDRTTHSTDASMMHAYAILHNAMSCVVL